MKKNDLLKKILILTVFVVLVMLSTMMENPGTNEPEVPDITVVEPGDEAERQPDALQKKLDAIEKDLVTDTKDEVALYILKYHQLPSNYMTKTQAKKKGWEGGALNQLIKGKCIGGDRYGNYEEVLPDIKGKYYECDIDTMKKKSRGSKRIVYDDDWDDIDIWYTDDHYETFTLLYGDGKYE